MGFFLVLLFRCRLCRRSVTWLNMPVVTHWLFTSMCVSSEAIIAEGVIPPVSMVSFPSMESLQPDWITDQPETAGSQIEILVSNQADVFAINHNVTVRNHHRFLDYWWCNIDWRRSNIDRLWRDHNLWHN